jgi:O-antigen/teichoic acid export membrane protein
MVYWQGNETCDSGKNGVLQAAMKSGLLKGAAILGAAAIISKLLGTMQKIPLQNIAGDGVFGIYNIVYPFYILILYVATAGFPVAISIFVAERVARGDYGEARRVLRVAVAILSASGIVCFLLMFYGAGAIAAAIGVPAAAPAIRSVSFALLLAPLMGALRGYFQGLQQMMPTAVSQVAEQSVRVAAMIWLLFYLTGIGSSDSYVAAGATFGSTAGALAGLLVMLGYWWRERAGANSILSDAAIPSPEPYGRLAKRFAAYALPICLGSIVLPMLSIADAFTMPRLLQMNGGNEQSALVAFGLYNHGLPLVQLVSMIATSMAVALVPAIAEAKQLRRPAVIRSRTEQALRLTWLVSLPASFGLAVAAVPLNVMFYERPDGSLAMAILAFTAVFSTVSVVAASILQGFGSVVPPALNMLAAAAFKIIGNVILTPLWGIEGAAVAAVLAFAVVCGLNVRLLVRATGARFDWRGSVVLPLASIALMCCAIALFLFAAAAVREALPDRLPARAVETVVALGAVLLGALVYPAAMLRLGAVTAADLALLPYAARFTPWLTRHGWVKP